MPTLKELSKREDLLSPGHRACAGCAATIIARQVLLAAGKDVVVGCATGCLEVVTTIFPYTAWRVPYIHNAFENVASTISGVEAAYNSLKRLGKVKRDLHFIAFGGDGGTYDIGLQALSGAAERGHRMLYVCYDNEAYMNTGIQRSGATPYGAETSTCP
ncbi:MAG TPA: pyruvate ferredoxin oxidoreductase, partial [Firmicutes bacterium]|nr:pyruvate ferredoxin oxidoreductase [Bacillota bacterium]